MLLHVGGRGKHNEKIDKILDRQAVFTTTGSSAALLAKPQMEPTAIVIDEVHERTTSNDVILDDVVVINLRRVANGKKPIAMDIASATGVEEVIAFLRRVYHLRTAGGGILDFKIVDLMKSCGFRYITIDLQGYRMGSLNEVFKPII